MPPLIDNTGQIQLEFLTEFVIETSSQFGFGRLFLCITVEA